jgi:hypothetical protein
MYIYILRNLLSNYFMIIFLTKPRKQEFALIAKRFGLLLEVNISR